MREGKREEGESGVAGQPRGPVNLFRCCGTKSSRREKHERASTSTRRKSATSRREIKKGKTPGKKKKERKVEKSSRTSSEVSGLASAVSLKQK